MSAKETKVEQFGETATYEFHRTLEIITGRQDGTVDIHIVGRHKKKYPGKKKAVWNVQTVFMTLTAAEATKIKEAFNSDRALL